MAESIAFIHNSLVLVESLKKITQEIIPEVEVINIIDESLLRDIRRLGKIDYKGVRRICGYIVAAEEMGVKLVLMTCSSLSETVDTARFLVNIPVLKIDEPMAEEAVKKGAVIGVVGTLKSVLEPSSRLIRKKATEQGREISIKKVLCEEAFKSLISGDPTRHDQLVLKAIKNLSDEVGVIVLAQGSMARLVPQLADKVKIPVLSCLRSGVERVKEVLEGKRQ